MGFLLFNGGITAPISVFLGQIGLCVFRQDDFQPLELCFPAMAEPLPGHISQLALPVAMVAPDLRRFRRKGGNLFKGGCMPGEVFVDAQEAEKLSREHILHAKENMIARYR